MKPSAVKELKNILGDENVRTGDRALAPYFRKPIPQVKLTVAMPADVHQLSDVAAFSSENEIPLFSVRRKYLANGDLAGKDGILVDLARMNQIKKIDARNLTAHVYAGVTFEQLKNELAKENQKVLYPVAGHSPCVLRSYIDRDILMGSGAYRHPHLSIFHAMLADGQLWISGSQQLTDEGHADFREDQGPQFSQFFGASEDIFGIPYYGLVYTYPVREERRLVAFGFDDITPAKDLLYKVSRAEWCFESFVANDRYLSVMLARRDRSKVSLQKKKLKPWTAVFTMEHHKELVELWEKYIKEAAGEVGGKQLRGQVPEGIESLLENPWYVYDRDFYRGQCDNIFCYQYFKNVADTFELIDERVDSAGASSAELGKIVVPTYFGGAAYCEADIYFDPDDEKSSESAKKSYVNAFEGLIDDGAFIDKPVGPVAQMLYSKIDPSYIEVIKLFKRSVDPKGLLNPDQLLEGV